MPALRFTSQSPPIAVNPNRSDVACFVGFVTSRDADELSLPVPLDSWSDFQQIFSADRPITANTTTPATSYLSAAVRSFFAQGGRRCYVIRVGDPWPIETTRSERLSFLDRLIPGFSQSTINSIPGDRTTWSSLGHLFGLEDVSFLCLPDLCDIVAADPEPLSVPTLLQRAPERFTACSAPQAAAPNDQLLKTLAAPRSNDEGFLLWSQALRIIASFLERHTAGLVLRPIQLVAAIPLPLAQSPASANLMPYLTSSDLDSRAVQLTYPWVRTVSRSGLPEELENPAGVLTGLLARNALSQGTYRSAAGLPMAETIEPVPTLPQQQLYQPNQQGKTLLERVSVLGPTPKGIQLLSDVTTSLDESVRPASVHRLIGVIIRAARQLGQAHLFEPSGPHLWSQLAESLRGLMTQLYFAGALRGATADIAFDVNCDRTTMTQNDIDNGRLIARIAFTPALPIERITVMLTLSDPPNTGRLPVVVTLQEAA